MRSSQCAMSSADSLFVPATSTHSSQGTGTQPIFTRDQHMQNYLHAWGKTFFYSTYMVQPDSPKSTHTRVPDSRVWHESEHGTHQGMTYIVVWHTHRSMTHTLQSTTQTCKPHLKHTTVRCQSTCEKNSSMMGAFTSCSQNDRNSDVRRLYPLRYVIMPTPNTEHPPNTKQTVIRISNGFTRNFSVSGKAM